MGVIRKYPFDLAVLSVVAIVAYGIVTAFPAGHELRLIAALPLVLFLPGYALISVLFPATARASGEAVTPGIGPTRGIGGVERCGLAFVVSLAIVPVVVIVLAVSDWGLTTESIATTLVVWTVALAQIGVVRRLLVPETERFSVSPTDLVGPFGTSSESAVATASSALLTLSIAVAAGALLLAFVAPQAAGGYTELGLYTENDDGELVAGETPEEIAEGESVPVTTTVENEEDEDVEYTLVVQQQYYEDGEITERETLDEVSADVSDGETAEADLSVAPTADLGETVRISVLLYEGDPPSEPTNENAEEDTYFWVSMGEEAPSPTGEDDVGAAEESEADDEGETDEEDGGDEAGEDEDDDEADEEDGDDDESPLDEFFE